MKYNKKDSKCKLKYPKKSTQQHNLTPRIIIYCATFIGTHFNVFCAEIVYLSCDQKYNQKECRQAKALQGQFINLNILQYRP